MAYDRTRLVRLFKTGVNGTVTITENTRPGSPIDVSKYRWAEVNVPVESGGGEEPGGEMATITFAEYQSMVNAGTIVAGTTYYVEL